MSETNNAPDPAAPAQDPASQQTPEQDPAAPQQQPTQPLAGKFQTPEALAQSTQELINKLGPEAAYKVLESQVGKPAAPAPTQQQSQPATPEALAITPTDPSSAPPQTINDVLTKVGVTAEQVAQEYAANNGRLNQDTYAKFQNAGYPPDVVNTHMAAQASQVQATRQQAASVAGGDEQLANLRQWAAVNVDPARLDQLNTMIKSNPAMYPEMIRILKADHAEAVGAGKAQPLVAGDTAPAGSLGKFTTEAEQNVAFRDPRFATTLPNGMPNPKHDAAFRAQTLARQAF